MKSTKNITYQSKLGKAIKVAVPMFAMLGSSAVASTSHVSTSVNGVQLNQFASFSPANVRPAGIQVDQQALSFLKENNLLTGNGIQQADVSGDLLAGRKVFSDENAAPVNTLPAKPAVNEDDVAVAIADDINVADADADDQTVTLTFTGGTGSLPTQNGINITTGDGVDDAKMVFSGTLVNINAALDSLTFTPTTDLSGENAASIQMQLADGNGGTDNDTVQFEIVAVNDAPAINLDKNDSSKVGGNHFKTTYYAGGAVVKIADVDTIISDVDDTKIESAQVILSEGFPDGENEKISINATPATIGPVNITYTSNKQIDLAGQATIAEYQTAIKAIEYSNSGALAAVTAGDRAVTVTVNDGDTNSANASTTVTVIGAPQITSATYNEDNKKLVVTGINFIALADPDNDVDISKITLTGEGEGTHTLTAAHTANVEIESDTQFIVTVAGTDVAAVENLLNINGKRSSDGNAFELAVADDFMAGYLTGDTKDTDNVVTVSGWPKPAIASVAYDFENGTLVVTGVDFIANGEGADVDASLFTFTGEGGVEYTLTDTPDVNRTNATTFTLTLSPKDKAAVNAIINKNGLTATGTAAYYIAVADNFITAATLGDTSDAGNAITASKVAKPALTVAVYNATAGTLRVTGTDIPSHIGATNDIDASLFTIKGEGGGAYTLVGTVDVERESATSFTLELDVTDKAAVHKLINKNGGAPTSGVNYSIAAGEDWAKGTDPVLNIVDNAITLTATDVAAPTITKATYNSDTGVLKVTGTGFFALDGATNDIDLSTLTLKGEGDAEYTLITADDVEITSATSFSATLAGEDKTEVNKLLHINGAQSGDTTKYKLAAAEDWNKGAGDDLVIVNADNEVTVSGWPQPEITSATYDAKTGALVVTGVNLEAKDGAANDVDVSLLTLIGEAGAKYQLTSQTNVEITSDKLFTVVLTGADKTNVNGLLNTNGIISGDKTEYSLAAADNWMINTFASVDIADTTEGDVTVSEVEAPVITAAAYHRATGVVTVTGTGFVNQPGADNDVDVSLFAVTGQGGNPYTLTTGSNIDITSSTSFNFVLGGADKTNVDRLLNKAGTTSNDNTAYNLAAAEDWMVATAAAAELEMATLAINVSGVTVPVQPSRPSTPVVQPEPTDDFFVDNGATPGVNRVIKVSVKDDQGGVVSTAEISTDASLNSTRTVEEDKVAITATTRGQDGKIATLNSHITSTGAVGGEVSGNGNTTSFSSEAPGTKVSMLANGTIETNTKVAATAGGTTTVVSKLSNDSAVMEVTNAQSEVTKITTEMANSKTTIAKDGQAKLETQLPDGEKLIANVDLQGHSLLTIGSGISLNTLKFNQAGNNVDVKSTGDVVITGKETPVSGSIGFNGESQEFNPEINTIQTEITVALDKTVNVRYQLFDSGTSINEMVFSIPLLINIETFELNINEGFGTPEARFTTTLTQTLDL